MSTWRCRRTCWRSTCSDSHGAAVRRSGAAKSGCEPSEGSTLWSLPSRGCRAAGASDYIRRSDSRVKREAPGVREACADHSVRIGRDATQEALLDQSLLEEPERVALQARNVHLRDSKPLGDLGLREAHVELHVDYGLLSLGQAAKGLAQVDVVPEFLELRVFGPDVVHDG